jgi:hypothetical protein
MALCALELLVTKQLLHGDNIDIENKKNKDMIRDMREDNYAVISNYGNWIEHALDPYKDDLTNKDEELDKSESSASESEDEKKH